MANPRFDVQRYLRVGPRVRLVVWLVLLALLVGRVAIIVTGSDPSGVPSWGSAFFIAVAVAVAFPLTRPTTRYVPVVYTSAFVLCSTASLILNAFNR